MTGEQISRRQIAEQITRCSQYDGRTLTPETFEEWYKLLGDLPYEDVEDAITVHYRTDRRWIMPANIVAHHEKLAAGRAIEAMRLSPRRAPEPGSRTLSARPDPCSRSRMIRMARSAG